MLDTHFATDSGSDSHGANSIVRPETKTAVRARRGTSSKTKPGVGMLYFLGECV